MASVISRNEIVRINEFKTISWICKVYTPVNDNSERNEPTILCYDNKYITRYCSEGNLEVILHLLDRYSLTSV